MTTAAPAQILGRHVWSDLMTTDMKGAEDFYKKVVGWTSEPFPNSPNPYIQFKRSGGAGAAGLMERPRDMNMPPFWSMYIAVPDLDEATNTPSASAVPNCPKSFTFRLSGGCRCSRIRRAPRFTSSSRSLATNPPDREPEAGEASWIELMTTDAPAAMQFYQELFGWQPGEAMDMGEMGKYHVFNRGSRMMGGMMNKPPAMAQVPPNWGIYFMVPDINAAAERVKANGGRILNGPLQVPGGTWILNALDPQGAAFSLHAK